MVAGGINFTVATARNLLTVEKILADVKLPVPIALMNGVLLYDMARRRYVKVHKIPVEAARRAFDIFRTFDITVFMYEMDGNDFFTYHETFGIVPPGDVVAHRVARYENAPHPHQSTFANAAFDNVVYFTLQDTEEKLRPIYDALSAEEALQRTFYQDVYHPGLWFLEIHSGQASKYKTVEFLRKTYGFDSVVGFGDNLNDLPLFQACDTKIAVSNAHPTLKTAADFICQSNENDGVVKWMLSNI